MKQISIILIFLSLAFGAMAAEQPSTKAERNFVHQGNVFFNDSNYHEAIRCYESALALNPNSPYALYNKAVALVQLATDDNKGTENDPRRVAAEIFTGIAKNKDYPALAASSAYNLGNMAFNDGKYSQAVEFYKESLRIRPDSRACRQNLLLALQKEEEQQNQQQDQQNQQQDQQQQKDQQQQQQQQQQEQQAQPEQMSQNAEQILQSVQNRENATRRRNNTPVSGRPFSEKPW